MISIVRFLFGLLRLGLVCTLLLIIIPIGISAAYKYNEGWPRGWNSADWSATNTAPDPAVQREAMIRVYAARTGRWKSVFAVHSWIALKPKNAENWTRYDVVGWGKALHQDAYPVDGRWYSNMPYVVHEIKGDEATRLIPKITAAIKAYPYAGYGDYKLWPGPNSNTFVATIVRAVPGLDAKLPATAVGKDFMGNGIVTGPMPSKTGWQISWSGIVGAGLSWEEGFELHFLGATLGINPLSLSITLPGIGRLSALDEKT